MANSYSQFSEMLRVNTKEAKWLMKILLFDPMKGDDLEVLVKELHLDGKHADLDGWPDFEWNLHRKEFWLHADESYTEDHLIWVMQALLKKFRPDFIFTMTGAGTCSRPRVGEFGGFWIAISANGVESGNTWDAVREAAEKLEQQS
jgi:hypothetical protein